MARHHPYGSVSADMSAHLVFRTPTSGWLATNSKASGIHLYRTTNGGDSWQRLRISSPKDMSLSTNIAGPSFSSDGQKGLLLVQYATTTGGSSIAAYQTQDGGQVWTLVHSALRIPPKSLVQAPATVSDQVAWFWINSYLEKTTDGGANWTRVAVGAPSRLSDKDMARSMVLVNSAAAWVVNERTQPDQRPFRSELLTTTNGGATWHRIN